VNTTLISRRYGVLAASMVVQVCLGGLFAWSTFVNPLMAGHGFTAAGTQAVFGATVAVFTATMIPAGRLELRFGPRVIAAAGGIFYGAGYVLAGCSGTFAGVILGISILGGMGIALGYVCPLTALIKWFPSRKGLITGISVAGFGAGAIVLSQVAGILMRSGVDVLTVFKWVGLGCGTAVFVAAMFLDIPEGWDANGQGAGASVRQAFGTRGFWSLLAGMFSGTFAGLIVVGSLKPMGIVAGFDVPTAELAIGALAIGNAAGRICWGWLADRIGRLSVTLSLLWMVVAVACMWPACASRTGYLIVSVAVGFGFGGCFVVYVTRIASTYGPGAVGTLYPYVFLFYGAAGLTGPVVAGRLFDVSGTYAWAVALACCVAALGMAISWFLARPAAGSESPLN
jgi:MFS transporter, OFA family, oxalate/formate antiporter